MGMSKRARLLAAEHWAYICELLHTHGEDPDVIQKCAFQYVEAFVHGYKHALEDIEAEVNAELNHP